VDDKHNYSRDYLFDHGSRCCSAAASPEEIHQPGS